MILISMILFVGNLLMGMDGVDLQTYALDPNSTIFQKLQSLSTQQDLDGLQGDSTWKDFGSMHWLTGRVQTSGGTAWVVKAPNHTPGVPIQLVPGMFVIHSDTQNLSRIVNKKRIDKAIKDLDIEGIRTVDTYVFPLSGNNDDLSNPNITDKDVLIIEECIIKSSDEMENISKVRGISLFVQKETMQIDEGLFGKLKKLVKYLRLPDQSPNNFFIDKNGILVLFDFEDVTRYQREQNAKKWFPARWISNFKLRCTEEGGADVALMVVASLNENSEVNQQAPAFLRGFKYKTRLKPYLFEISGVIGTVSVVVRHVLYVRAVNNLTNNCCFKINEACLAKPHVLKDPSLLYQEVKEIVTSLAPSETRKEVFEAFTIIALAEHNNDHGPIELFGTTYASKYVASQSATRKIKSIWCSDRSLRSKCYRSIKSAVSSVVSLTKLGSKDNPALATS